MSKALLGRLEKVDLAEAWDKGTEFSPWLTQEENLRQLSEVLGMRLEYVPQEKISGPFRGEVICREKDNPGDHWVLFQSQLDQTNNAQLGEMITHNAGLEQVSVVWIAAGFADQHKAALDWLNNVTNERCHFFGVELELWRINNSPVAPTFTVVCKPNDWTKRLELNDQQQLQMDYWSAFRDVLAERKSKLQLKNPKAKSWAGFPIGKAGFDLWTFVNARDERIGIVLETYGGHAKAHFHLLKKEAEAIHRELAENLEWDERPGKKGAYIMLRWHGVDPSDQSKWREQHAWLADKLLRFYDVMAPRVQELDATEYFQDDEHADLTAVVFPADDLTFSTN